MCGRETLSENFYKGRGPHISGEGAPQESMAGLPWTEEDRPRPAYGGGQQHNPPILRPAVDTPRDESTRERRPANTENGNNTVGRPPKPHGGGGTTPEVLSGEQTHPTHVQTRSVRIIKHPGPEGKQPQDEYQQRLRRIKKTGGRIRINPARRGWHPSTVFVFCLSDVAASKNLRAEIGSTAG